MSDRKKHFISPHCQIELPPAGPAMISLGGQTFRACPHALVSMAQVFTAAAHVIESQQREHRLRMGLLDDDQLLH